MTDALLPLKATYEQDGNLRHFYFESGFDLKQFVLLEEDVPISAAEKFVGGYPVGGVVVGERYKVVKMSEGAAARFCKEMQAAMVSFVRSQISRKMIISVEATESLI